jgi:hypothetical protein
MSNVYIERNKDGAYEVKLRGSPIPVAVAPTQKEAEERAKQLYPNIRPDVERVRDTDKGQRDKWRKE